MEKIKRGRGRPKGSYEYISKTGKPISVFEWRKEHRKSRDRTISITENVWMYLMKNAKKKSCSLNSVMIDLIKFRIAHRKDGLHKES